MSFPTICFFNSIPDIRNETCNSVWLASRISFVRKIYFSFKPTILRVSSTFALLVRLKQEWQRWISYSTCLRKRARWARDRRDTARGRARASQPQHFHGKRVTRARHRKEYGTRLRGPGGNRIAALDTRVAAARAWGACNFESRGVQIAKLNSPTFDCNTCHESPTTTGIIDH